MIPVYDRVKETCTSPGTGTVTLQGAAMGFQAFSAVLTGGSTYYCIADKTGSNWEIGTATYSANTLTRVTVSDSSGGPGVTVNFASGVQDVFIPYPARKAVTGPLSTADVSGLGSAATQASSAFDAAGAATTAQTFSIQRANHTGTQAWGTLTGTPTTKAGYGITDVPSGTGTVSGTNTGDAPLPVATTTVLGGVKQGSGTTIAADGTLSVSAGHYTHAQSIASASWAVIHNLGKFPSVSIVDSAGTLFVGDVHYIDLNSLTVSFGAAFGGSAYLN